MLTRHAITRRADRDGVDAAVVERDYVLAHVVAQLHRAGSTDGGRLIFKGGTALRLVHVGKYRYSADLDLTVLDGRAGPAVAGLSEVLGAAKAHAGLPVLELTSTATPTIAYIGPLGASKRRYIKVDAADDEYVESVYARDDPRRRVGRPAGPCPIRRLPDRRDRSREATLRHPARPMPSSLRPLPPDRGTEALTGGDPAAVREQDPGEGLDPRVFAERFEDRIERYKRRWDEEMGEHVADPPRFEDVVRVVRRHLRAAELL